MLKTMYGITFVPGSGLSQYRQLVDQLRNQIISGNLASGTRLVSSREMAQSLGIARGIVLEAVDQLQIEGYLRTVQGSGTFVCENLLWDRMAVHSPPDPVHTDPPAPQRLSFVPGLPDLSLFPRRAWLKCYHQAVEYAEPNDLAYPPPPGREDLRQALSNFLWTTKGIPAPPGRIVITAGASQAFALAAGLFHPARVAMEDPQAPFVRRVFDGLGCGLTWVPVDEEGIIPDRIPPSGFDLLYLTPNHQFPVGGTLSAERRVAVLHRAAQAGAWVIEDDFDSEFRYVGHPVSPLAALAPDRVLYVGTFSKNLAPALRLGFLVVPPGLQARVKSLKLRWDLWNEGFQQKALARFITEGHLERHLLTCHRAYKKKNAFIKKLTDQKLKGLWRVTGATTGMHLVLRKISPASGTTENGASYARKLADQGLEVHPLSDYCQENQEFQDALVVAYGNRSEAELERLVDALKNLVTASTSVKAPH